MGRSQYTLWLLQHRKRRCLPHGERRRGFFGKASIRLATPSSALVCRRGVANRMLAFPKKPRRPPHGKHCRFPCARGITYISTALVTRHGRDRPIGEKYLLLLRQIRGGNMVVIKRDGRKEPVYLFKMIWRIQTRCYDLNMEYVNPSAIALRVLTNLPFKITTVELDELLIETLKARIDIHPDFATLAGRIAMSKLHKETKERFSEVMADLYHAEGSVTNERWSINDEKYQIIQRNADRLDSAIRDHRDNNYSYATFKMFERDHLSKLNGKVVERPQHMLMRIAVNIHGEDIDKVVQSYDVMSRHFIHSPRTRDISHTVRLQIAL